MYGNFKLDEMVFYFVYAMCADLTKNSLIV